jgi:hypothetical protein
MESNELALQGFGCPGSLVVAAGAVAVRPAAAVSAYLETVFKDCDGSRRGSAVRYEVAACGCRSWFCRHCCCGRGLSLRERLEPILATFSGLQMWTLTVDPELFSSPAAALEHVTEKRCVANLVRRLHERGWLHSRRYFCVVEWQKETQMAHFHLLLDASFVEFDVVCELWNRYRPESAGPVRGLRPGFGSVRFSAPRFADHRHACRYACKYLIKFPEHGYPGWVMDYRGQVHRYLVSHGFWSEGADGPVRAAGEGGADAAEPDGVVEGSTIRQRTEACGAVCVVFLVNRVLVEGTGEMVECRRFVRTLGLSFSGAGLRWTGDVPRGRRFVVPPGRMEQFLSEIGIE